MYCAFIKCFKTVCKELNKVMRKIENKNIKKLIIFLFRKKGDFKLVLRLYHMESWKIFYQLVPHMTRIL